MNSPSTSSFGPMFETYEDRSAEHAYSLLRAGGADGVQLTAPQLKLLRILVGQLGAGRAISAAKLARMTESDDRAIRNDVRELRMLFGVRIGSSRDNKDPGYYLITSKEELFDTVRPFANQLKAEAALIRAMCSPHELAELEGQMQLTISSPLAPPPEATHAIP